MDAVEEHGPIAEDKCDADDEHRGDGDEVIDAGVENFIAKEGVTKNLKKLQRKKIVMKDSQSKILGSSFRRNLRKRTQMSGLLIKRTLMSYLLMMNTNELLTNEENTNELSINDEQADGIL